jgi:hypothetical protein
MKKFILLAILTSGCSTFSIPLAQTQIAADQTNQLVSGIAGPNQVSAGLLEFQNYNRNLNASMQNPWLAFFEVRDLWVH